MFAEPDQNQEFKKLIFEKLWHVKFSGRMKQPNSTFGAMKRLCLTNGKAFTELHWNFIQIRQLYIEIQ